MDTDTGVMEERPHGVGGGGLERLSIPLVGMTCAACATRIQRKLERGEGVRSAVVNYGTERATVEYDPSESSVSRLIGLVRSAGYDARTEVVSLTVRGLEWAATGESVERSLSAVRGVVETLARLRGALSLDSDVSAQEQVPTQKRDPVQGLLVEGAERQRKVGEEDRGIEEALVVRSEDVSTPRNEVLPALDFDRNPAGLEDEPGPQAGDPMGGITAPENHRENEGHRSADDGIDRDQWYEPEERAELRPVDRFNLDLPFYREAAAAPGASMVFPKIIFPAVVWRTLVTVMSTFFPRSFRALSTTTMVPSSR